MITKLVYLDEDNQQCALRSDKWIISRQSSDMGEAENQKLWGTDKWSRYKKILRWVCERDKDPFGYYDRVHATAAQRAEAFLRTLNLWTTA